MGVSHLMIQYPLLSSAFSTIVIGLNPPQMTRVLCLIWLFTAVFANIAQCITADTHYDLVVHDEWMCDMY